MINKTKFVFRSISNYVMMTRSLPRSVERVIRLLAHHSADPIGRVTRIFVEGQWKNYWLDSFGSSA